MSHSKVMQMSQRFVLIFDICSVTPKQGQDRVYTGGTDGQRVIFSKNIADGRSSKNVSRMSALVNQHLYANRLWHLMELIYHLSEACCKAWVADTNQEFRFCCL
jgi:hypothetical protein